MKKVLILLCLFTTLLYPQTGYQNINSKISKGEFKQAALLIDNLLLSENISDTEKYDLEFQKQRMDRIRKDFGKTAEDILTYIRKYYPDAGTKDLEKWEMDGTLEFMIIDGDKFYFNRAQTNLFRVNKTAKEQKIKVAGAAKDGLDQFLEQYLPTVVEKAKKSKNPLVNPVRMKINYKLAVNADAVPDGEVIRAWLPFPREGHKRQHSINFISASEPDYIIADNKYLQRTIYMEKASAAGKPTEFSYELEYTAQNEWHQIQADKVKSYNKERDLYKKYTSERKPHIIFSEKIKTLSGNIIGDETNPVLKAKKIYKWINDNIPWAGAREYSTIMNISDYCISNGWGDCGIQTLTFMTLCRFNGIPTKWQSGWMLHPGEINLHDWCEIYFEGYGWLPIDQSFKLVDSENNDVKWFFFGGIDAFHFIVNDDYSQQLYPVKIFPRSETVDFQRGEVEWKGGNLYFDQWDYWMKVDYIDPEFKK